MSFELAVILSFTILIPGLFSLVRYAHIHRSYYPFLYLIWLGCINELLSFILVMNRINSSINSNIYVLAASLLIVYFLKRQNAFKNFKHLFWAIINGLIILWVIENIILGKLTSVSVFFRIIFALIIVLLSITLINNSISNVRKNILTNSEFLISTAFIISFTFKILVETFWLYGLNSSPNFQIFVYDIMIYINVLCNLFYSFAILWMPKKQIFTMQS